MKYDQLQAYFVEAVRDIRAKLAAANVPEFEIKLAAEGRTMTGDAKITYTISDSRYSGVSVEGHDIQKCLDEMLRRKGWNKANAPLCLPTIGEPGFKVED